MYLILRIEDVQFTFKNKEISTFNEKNSLYRIPNYATAVLVSSRQLFLLGGQYDAPLQHFLLPGNNLEVL